MSLDLVKQHTTLTTQLKQTYANKHYVKIDFYLHEKKYHFNGGAIESA